MIRKVKSEDAKQICNIYNYYVEQTLISFEEEPVSEMEMLSRIKDIKVSLPWLVYEKDGRVIGYAYAHKWRERSAYRFSVESSVYIKNEFIGKGVGSELYKSLLVELKNSDVHAVIGVITLPNEKSQRIHEKFGFVKVAHFSEVGFKFNKWIDVGYWELILTES